MGVEAVGYRVEAEEVERTFDVEGSLDAITARVLAFVFLALLIIACATIAITVSAIAAPIIGVWFLISLVSKSVSFDAP